MRGGPAFAVSLVLSAAEPHFRQVAELGAWQIISPASCWGRLEVVPDLHGIQEKVGGAGRGGARQATGQAGSRSTGTHGMRAWLPLLLCRPACGAPLDWLLTGLPHLFICRPTPGVL